MNPPVTNSVTAKGEDIGAIPGVMYRWVDGRWVEDPSDTKPAAPEPSERAKLWADELAGQIAAQCWCHEETSGIEMDGRLANVFAWNLSAWLQSYAQAERNTAFYRGIVCEVGELFGVAAKTSDDGSVQEDVLALKVPELVRAAVAALAAPVPAAPSESIQAVREAVALLHDKGLHTEAVALGAHLKKIEGALAVPAVVEPCAWKEDEDGNWWTGCGEGHVFTDGGPVENGAMFCCYCGSALASVTGSEQERT